MKDNVVILARIGFYGLSHELTPSKAWEFETYDEAENKLKMLYSAEIGKSMPKPLQSSVYDAETGQFKIIGDDSIVVGFIMTSNGNTNIDADYLGVNMGPDPEV
jgi:hypothetical protein